MMTRKTSGSEVTKRMRFPFAFRLIMSTVRSFVALCHAFVRACTEHSLLLACLLAGCVCFACEVLGAHFNCQQMGSHAARCALICSTACMLRAPCCLLRAYVSGFNSIVCDLHACFAAVPKRLPILNYFFFARCAAHAAHAQTRVCSQIAALLTPSFIHSS